MGAISERDREIIDAVAQKFLCDKCYAFSIYIQTCIIKGVDKKKISVCCQHVSEVILTIILTGEEALSVEAVREKDVTKTASIYRTFCPLGNPEEVKKDNEK